MKVVKAVILLMYLISYVYAVHMTSIEPKRDLWGYMCVTIFAILCYAGVIEFSKNSKKNNNEKEE